MEQESRGWTQCGALATLQAKQTLWNYELGKNGSRKPRDFLRRENGDVEWTAEPLGVSSLRRRREEEKLRNSAEGTEQSGWRERLLLCLTARKRVREGAGRTGAFLLGPQCTVASSSSAGLGILWGRHGAQTEGRKVQKRTNIKSEFLAAPGDDDSFWWQQRLISWAASHRVAQRQHAWNKLFWCPVVDFINSSLKGPNHLSISRLLKQLSWKVQELLLSLSIYMGSMSRQTCPPRTQIPVRTLACQGS